MASCSVSWSGCWWLTCRDSASPTLSARHRRRSPGRSVGSASNQGILRLDAVTAITGLTLSGSSSEPMHEVDDRPPRACHKTAACRRSRRSRARPCSETAEPRRLRRASRSEHLSRTSHQRRGRNNRRPPSGTCGNGRCGHCPSTGSRPIAHRAALAAARHRIVRAHGLLLRRPGFACRGRDAGRRPASARKAAARMSAIVSSPGNCGMLST